MCHHIKKPPLVGVGPVWWHSLINVSRFGLFLVEWFDPRAMMAPSQSICALICVRRLLRLGVDGHNARVAVGNLLAIRVFRERFSYFKYCRAKSESSLLY